MTATGRKEPSVDRSRSSRPFYSKSNDYKRQLHIAMRSDTFNADWRQVDSIISLGVEIILSTQTSKPLCGQDFELTDLRFCRSKERGANEIDMTSTAYVANE
jgi:hypothetical protein